LRAVINYVQYYIYSSEKLLEAVIFNATKNNKGKTNEEYGTC
jgi:hypothetical protein